MDSTLNAAPARTWRTETVPGDVALAYGRTGAGADPVVALHGITAHHRAFTATARELTHPDGMVAVDLRGRGASAKPAAGAYGLATHSSDVMRVLDHLGVGRGVLVGHSMGCFVALHAALHHPERVRGLVLVDGGWPRPDVPAAEPDAGVRAGLARAFSRLDRTFATPAEYLDFWFPGQGLGFDDLDADLADYYRYDTLDTGAGLVPRALRVAAEEDSASMLLDSLTVDELGRIACPVSLVRAAEGFATGTPPLLPDPVRDTMVRALDVREDVLVDGATHYTVMFADYARSVARVIDGLISSPD